MYPLKTIIEFLLAGVSRILPSDRADAMCTIFAGLLPEMSEAEISAARQQVIARFWASPEITEPVVNLIDGHLVLRTLIQGGDGGCRDAPGNEERPCG